MGDTDNTSTAPGSGADAPQVEGQGAPIPAGAGEAVLIAAASPDAGAAVPGIDAALADPVAVQAPVQRRRGRKSAKVAPAPEPASAEPAPAEPETSAMPTVPETAPSVPADEPAPAVQAAEAKAKAETAAGPSRSEIARRLRDVVSERGLGVAEAAAQIGVSQPGLRRILFDLGLPNARTAALYAAWLEAPARPVQAAATKRVKPVKPVKSEKRAPAPSRAEVKAAAERAAAFRFLRECVASAGTAQEPAIDPAVEALAGDDLARRVHAASAKSRAAIAATLDLLEGRGRRGRR